jgi:AAA domain
MTEPDPVPLEEARRAPRRGGRKRAANGGGDPFDVIDHADREVKAPAPRVIEATEASPTEAHFMWFPRIPAGMITLIGGRGGHGKGLVCASITASVTTRMAYPDGTDSGLPRHVLWGETEDPIEQVLLPRVIAAGADRQNLSFATPGIMAGLDLPRFVRERGTRLIVLSPLLSFMTELENMNDEMGVRGALGCLQDSIAGTDCALLGIVHPSKKADLAAVERLLGSVAFTNFVRSVLLVAPEGEKADRMFRMVHAKSNLAIAAGDLLYHPFDAGAAPPSQYVKLRWEVPDADVDADALFDRRKQAGNGSAPSAGEWLVEYLKEHGETMRQEVINAGEIVGHKEHALRKAQERNKKIASRQIEFHGPYHWRLT